jgi:hypothetical protein
MKKLMLGILVGAAGVYAFNHAARDAPASETADAGDAVTEQVEAVEAPDRPRFRCDGREYCAQMTSCEEAMFFLENCPGVKMDGEGDGIPCENQWCGRR